MSRAPIPCWLGRLALALVLPLALAATALGDGGKGVSGEIVVRGAFRVAPTVKLKKLVFHDDTQGTWDKLVSQEARLTDLEQTITGELGGNIGIAKATPEEKESQLGNLREFQETNRDRCAAALRSLKKVVLKGGNIFDELLNTVQYASLGQITDLLYQVGGKYRRNV